MKYWVFESGDVVGPYSPQELMERDDFGPHCLVCPENKGEDSSAWQEAGQYSDFSFQTHAEQELSSVEEDADKSDVFEEELNTLLEENSPLSGSEKPAEEDPAENLHVPAQAPSKPGPIEDYFNNIKGEDLGNILGIPDPNENSDMNLARALQSQFSQTQPPQHEGETTVLEEDPFDAFTAKEDLEDKQSFPQEELDGVEPSTSQAPVVLAGTPEKETAHPKYRIRKKADESAVVPPAARPVAPAGQGAAAAQPKHTNKETAPSSSNQTAPEAVLKDKDVKDEPDEKPAAVTEEPVSTPAEAKELEDASQVKPQPAQKEAEVLTKTPQEEQNPSMEPSQKEVVHPIPVPLTEDSKEPQEPQPNKQPVVAEEGTKPLSQAEPESVPEKEDSVSKKSTSLPALEELDQQASLQETEQPNPTQPEAEPEQPVLQEEPKLEEISKTEAVAPVAAEVKEEPQQPQQPAPEQAPVEPAIPAEEEKTNLPQEEEAPSAVPQPAPAPAADAVGAILHGAVDVAETPEVKEPIKEVSPVVEAQVNRVKPALRKTAEIDHFLNEKIKEEKESRPLAKKIIWLLGVLIVFLALMGLWWLFSNKPTAVPAAPADISSVVKEGNEVDELVPDTSVQVPSAQEVLSAPAAPKAPEISPQEKALQVVKNYELPNSNGKIGDYFDRIYKTKLAQGYNAVWSATKLHNNVYVVKYRISKTRVEPVVYLFEVDVAQNKLIAALNNITIDLVGKIN